ncbi:JNK_SAPK-associated protein-1 [Nesidiocoris tenuis]|uniref:JNK_SAPK-associated protein-1 n=1 Tax=Nesidiocoris tenuis TaxID=355587 RepID=A0ABN7AHE2_9HEMI|nr:JNK_SAPK-associated protein-1 [Nesidiocoris tenuis]
MDEVEEISVMDVYDIVTDFAKEFRPIIEMYGADPLNNIMSKVVTILEHLEAQTVKIGHLHTMIHERDAIISKLERDKADKAADRQRFEKELEQIEEHWRDESKELVAVVNKLQDENKKLAKSLAAKQDATTFSNTQPLSPELDIAVLQKLRTSIDTLREQLKGKEKEINSKCTEIENLSDQVDRATNANRDLRKKMRQSQNQIRCLIDERADFLTQIQDQNYELNILRQRLGVAEKENLDLAQCQPLKSSGSSKETQGSQKMPTYSSDELKELLAEKNELKARISQLEEELQRYKLNEEPIVPNAEEDNQPIDEEDEEEEGPVQGPLPYEPSDAPWRKSESGIRKLFRKFFNETNMTFLGNSPKKSLSTLSQMSVSPKSDSRL